MHFINVKEKQNVAQHRNVFDNAAVVWVFSFFIFDCISQYITNSYTF